MAGQRLVEEWVEHKAAVFGVAYRLLGDVAAAEDVVQEVWVRADAADRSGVRDLRAWLVTIAARTAYNVLNSARARRESYVGPWLPAPLLTGPDAAEEVLVDESVGTAMLLVMEELTPPERVAFVLHEVFEVPFDEIGAVLDRSSAAARKLASRARRRIAAARESTPRTSRAERERVLAAFRAAVATGDVDALVRLLHPDVVYVADGGGRVAAARVPVHGAERVARMLVKLHARVAPGAVRTVEVGGELAFAAHRDDGRLVWVDTVEVADGRVTVYRRLVNPEKLGHI